MKEMYGGNTVKRCVVDKVIKHSSLSHSGSFYKSDSFEKISLLVHGKKRFSFESLLNGVPKGPSTIFHVFFVTN